LKARVWLPIAGIGVLLAACADETQPPGCDPCPPPPDTLSPGDLVHGLAIAYQTRNYELFASLLAHDPDRNADYLYLQADSTGLGQTALWGYGEEVRIHRRMFRPEDPLPGEAPVHADLWLSSITVHLTPKTSWEERTDLYSADRGADGKLDPAVWKAVEAAYSADLLLDTQSEVDYQIRATEIFVVIEDLTRQMGAPGKFLLLSWTDLCSAPRSLGSLDSGCWTAVKSLYI